MLKKPKQKQMIPSEASTTKRGVVYLNDFRSLVWKSQPAATQDI